MKNWILSVFVIFGCSGLSADPTPTEQSLASYYDDFISEQEKIIYDAGLSDAFIGNQGHANHGDTPSGGQHGGNHPNNPGHHSTKPSDPPKPPPPPGNQSNLLPIVIQNHSGYDDDDVYIVVQSGATQFLQIDSTTSVGTLEPATNNGSYYSKKLSELTKTPTGRVFYAPNLSSGNIWFSMEKPLDMEIISGNIAQPDGLDRTNENFHTLFDVFEFTFHPGTMNSVIADATAVTSFAIPLYGYLANHASVSVSNTGLYQSRKEILSHIQNVFNSHPAATEWMKLLITDNADGTGNILRVSAPEKAMAAVPSIFDAHYLDDEAKYQFSYLKEVFTGSNSFYQQNLLTFHIHYPTTVKTYQGHSNANGTINLTNTDDSSDTVTLYLSQNGFTFSRTIFGGMPLFYVPDPQNIPTPPHAESRMSVLLAQAIVSGIVPTTTPLTSDTIQSHSPYYTVNQLLSPTGKSSGPWYDLYSKSLHRLGPIYTFAYDETLWPNVQLNAAAFEEGETYLGITIGYVKETVTKN